MAFILKAVVNMPYTTGIPRDCTVNVHHFLLDDDPDEAEFEQVELAIRSFYAVDLEDDPNSALGRYLSVLVSRSVDAVRVTAYDAQADPQVPLGEFRFTLPPALTVSMLPAEVAAVISTTCTPNLPVPAGRRRGRVYLGPLNQGLLGTTEIGGTQYPAINTAFRERAIAVSERMTEVATLARWAVYSPTNDQAYEISGGFVNNEFDTQRRRQVDATVRTTWGVPFP